ncbi:MAG: glycosyltransferase family 2 protein [Gemmatimonadales bacterium]
MVSVVLPIFNERDNLPPLLVALDRVLESVEHEIIAVDDGSSDGSLDELEMLQHEHSSVVIVALETHAGQSAAFAAGFEVARGEIVITMDADGQNSADDIPGMLETLAREPGLAAVIGYRANRADSRWKRVQSRVANSVRNWITSDGVRDTGCSLRAMRREVLAKLPRFNGMHRFYPTLIRLAGGIVQEMPVAHLPRTSGSSKYGMWDRLFVGLYDAVGVRWLSRRALRYNICNVRMESE